MVTQGQVFATTGLVELFPSCVRQHDLKPDDSEPLKQCRLPMICDLSARQDTSDRR